jgi:hypothetical protein
VAADLPNLRRGRPKPKGEHRHDLWFTGGLTRKPAFRKVSNEEGSYEMLQTEEQRRWWFANHPEYSSHKTGAKHARASEIDHSSSKINPKDVDAYVDKALNYVSGSVADLLKSVKYHFGSPILEDRVNYLPGLPTLEDIFRLPDSLFWRWFDRMMQNNPLLIDPNALERHHQLPKKFVKYFKDCGIGIDAFIIIMRAADHRLKPEGLHTGEGKGGNWNSEWEEFIKANPVPEDTEKRKREIKDKLNEMIVKYGIDKNKILSSAKPKRK